MEAGGERKGGGERVEELGLAGEDVRVKVECVGTFLEKGPYPIVE